MDLKVLLRIDDQIQVREVCVEEEDACAYKINMSGINMIFVRKTDLYTYINGKVFGTDVTKMIKVWNDAMKKQEQAKEFELKIIRKSILPEEFQGKIYKINK